MDYHNNSQLLELFPTLARTSSSNAAAVDVKDYVGTLKIILASTAGTGTSPTLDVVIQHSEDGSTGWTTIGTFTQVTDAADAHEAIGLVANSLRRYIRASSNIAGTTPSFTFSVVAIGERQHKP